MSKLPPAPLFTVKGTSNVIHCVLFHVNGDKEILLAGMDDGTVHIWDLKSCKRIRIFRVSTHACLSLHVTNQYLVAQDKTCTLSVWNLAADTFNRLFSRKYDNISFCRISILDDENDDPTLISIPQPQSRVDIHNFSSEKIQFLISCRLLDDSVELGQVMHLKMFRVRSEAYVAVMYENGMLIVWDMRAKAMICDRITSDTPMSFDFDSVGLFGICGTAENNLFAFKLNETSWRVAKRKTFQVTNPGAGCLRIRSDRKIVAVGCWDGKIRIFSGKTCELLAVLECHTESVLDVCFASSTGNAWHCKHLLAAVAGDKRISLWNIYE